MKAPAPPPEREIAAPLLKRVLATILVAALLLSLISASTHVLRSLWLACGNVAIAFVMVVVAKRGWVRTASVVVVTSLMVTAIYALTTGDHLHDDALLIFPGVFLFTSLLLGGVWAVATTCVSATAVVVLGLLEIHGYLPRSAARPVNYHEILEIVVLLGTLASFSHYVVQLMRNAWIDARNAHQSVKDIIDATNEAIFIHDAKDGRILSVNEPTLDMFGMGRDDFLGQTPFDIKQASAEHDGAKAAEYIRRAVTEGPQSFEWSTLRKDGIRMWVEVSLRSARIAGEARVIAVVRDVTERRSLEQRVREAETLRAVGQLAGGVAHDFNNQLVGMLGNAEFLRDALPPTSELRECAESVLVSGRRAADLTQQLLAFARKGLRRNVPVDLHRLIREVVTLGKRSIDKRIVIEERLLARRSTLAGDPSALQNALLNLLLNARDAMPSGGTVRFQTDEWDASRHRRADFEPQLPSGQYVLLEVADGGVGIASDTIGRIFEPFFTTKETGTGMGLAAVRGTVLDHGGSIAVDSQLGTGTRFRLCFPLTDAVAVGEPPKPSIPRSKGTGRVLVVDDEAAVANVIRRAVELGGLTVDYCGSGLEALERYHPLEHELVLLDVMMPDLDGVEVLTRLRAMSPEVKVMLMSGHASDTVEARLREFADVAVVAKPFSPLQLLEEVQKRLEG